MFVTLSVVAKNASVQVRVCFWRFWWTQLWAGCWTQGKTQQEKGGSEEVGKVVPQESHNSSWPARTVWHKQGGLDRSVVKKPREGINDSDDLWPLSPPREREWERHIVILWLKPDCFFFFFLLRYLLSFQQQDFLQGDSSKAQRILGWKPKVTFEVCVIRLQAGTNSLIWLRMFCSMSGGREVFSSVMEDQAKIANGH